MDLENALSLIKEVCEDHGAKRYLDAFDTVSKELTQALKFYERDVSCRPCYGTGTTIHQNDKGDDICKFCMGSGRRS